jgi:glutaredoxin
MKRVTLYTKPGCHLCESVEQVVARVAAKRKLDVETRNIEADPSDFQKYQFDIPVVLVDGKEVARHRLTVREFEAALDQ